MMIPGGHTKNAKTVDKNRVMKGILRKRELSMGYERYYRGNIMTQHRKMVLIFSSLMTLTCFWGYFPKEKWFQRCWTETLNR